MKIDEIRKMSMEEIKNEVMRSYMELRNVKDEMRVGKEKDVKKSLKIKRNIARMLTVLRQMEKK